MRRTVFTPALVWALAAGGCFANEETFFPPGLEPLEENIAPAPEPREGEPHPEELVMVRTTAAGVVPRTDAVHARGFVRAPILDVWAALRDPDVGADRRTFASWSVTYDVESEYDYSYVIHSRIENVIVVEYDVTWRHGAVEGTVEAPALVSARYQKTSGSSAISDLRGHVLLTRLGAELTEVAVVEYLDAVASGHENIEAFLRDMFAELVILSHGGTLPPVEEL